MHYCPSVTIAGLGGDNGKTFIALGLAAGWVERGFKVAPFKKGPDYIDAAWLSLASGAVCRNLDSYLMPREEILRTWSDAGQEADVAVLEGNRGLFDGMDVDGTHSTSDLAKQLGSPVLLVIDATKATRTVAAIVLGVREFDPDLPIAGVILNKIGSLRHVDIAAQAIELYTGIKVLGAIPRLKDAAGLLPGRHLGLVTAAEHPSAREAIELARLAVEEAVDVSSLLVELATEHGTLTACLLPAVDLGDVPDPPPDFDPGGLFEDRHIEVTLATGQEIQVFGQVGPEEQPKRVRIGVVRDEAFSFYYPENLETLEGGPVDLVMIDSLRDEVLPDDLHALYIGGGFPETHADWLGRNESFLTSLRDAALDGLPIYAECGGLMLLCREIEFEGQIHKMAGVFPLRAAWSQRPRGHGYVQGVIETMNPFYPIGTKLKGHEFHYSHIVPLGEEDGPDELSLVMALNRGNGISAKRDGLLRHNVLALYTHVHAAGQPEWAEGMISAARRRDSESK